MLRQSRAVSVVQFFTWNDRPPSFGLPLPLPFRLPSASPAIGVFQFFTAVLKPSPLCADAPLRLWLPQTVGVGHKPDPLSFVRRANVFSTKQDREERESEIVKP